jgi:segregation and condensation protein B
MPQIKDVLKALMISSGGAMLNIDDFCRAMPDISTDTILDALTVLKSEGGDTYDVVEIQENYFVRTKSEYVEYLRRIKGIQPEPKQRRALIETLAIIAMRQPVSRNEIEAIRCVQLNVSILHDLQDYGWIRVVKVTSNDAHLYGTTLKFLQDFNISSVNELEQMHIKDVFNESV